MDVPQLFKLSDELRARGNGNPGGYHDCGSTGSADQNSKGVEINAD